MPISNPALVASQVLTDVVNRLADPVIGFNQQLIATIANNPRYTLNAPWLTNIPLQFPSNYAGCSPNVILAPISLDDWIATSNVVTSGNNLLMQIYVINAVQLPTRQQTKGLIFDGNVQIGIDFHVLWPNQTAVYDFDAPTSAVEDTLYAIFNTVFPTSYQHWSNGVIYNGRLSIPARTAIVRGGPGWLQMTTCTILMSLQKR